MIKRALLTLALVSLLTGCGSTKEIIVEDVPAIELSEEPPIHEEPEIETKEEPAVEPLVTKELSEDFTSKALERLTDGSEYFMYVSYSSIVESDNFNYTAGHKNSEGVDTHSTEWWLSSESDIISSEVGLTHYIAEVDGKPVCVAYDHDTNSFTPHNNYTDHYWLIDIWNSVQLKEEAYRDDAVIQYSASLPTTALPKLKDKLSAESLDCVVVYSASTGDLKRILVSIPDFDNHKGISLSISVEFGDQLSSSPLGFEEVTGYEAPGFDEAMAPDLIEEAFNNFDAIKVKQLNFTLGYNDGDYFTVHNQNYTYDETMGRWSSDGNSYSDNGDMTENYWRSNIHYSKDNKCVMFSEDTLAYEACDSSCCAEIMSKFTESISIGKYLESSGVYSSFAGTVNSEYVPYICGMIDTQELNCVITVNNQQKSIVDVSIELPEITVSDGKTYPVDYIRIGYSSSENMVEPPIGFEEAVGVNE